MVEKVVFELLKPAGNLNDVLAVVKDLCHKGKLLWDAAEKPIQSAMRGWFCALNWAIGSQIVICGYWLNASLLSGERDSLILHLNLFTN